MLIGPRPASFFHLLEAGATDEAKRRVEALNHALKRHHKSVVDLSARTPAIQFRPEERLTPIGEADSVYDVAFILNTEVCFGNAWHGINDVILSLLGAKVAFAVVHVLGKSLAHFSPTEADADDVVAVLLEDLKMKRHVLLAQAPRRNIWGQQNSGCPEMNQYPYGVSVSTTSGWMVLSLFNNVSVAEEPGAAISALQNDGIAAMMPATVAASHDSDPLVPADDDATNSARGFGLLDQTTEKDAKRELSNVLFHKETTPTRAYNSSTFGLHRAVAARYGFVYGATTLCDLHLDDFPVSLKWPYYIQKPFCPWLYDVAKKFYLRQLGLAARDQPVAEDELRCPRIVVVSRALRRNGRGLMNERAVVEELERLVASGGPQVDGRPLLRCGHVTVVALEQLPSVRTQIRRIQNATVLVGTRGMGLIYAAFLRNRAGLVALSGHDSASPTSVPKENYAWHPLRAAKPSVPTVLATCPVVFPKDSSSPFAQKCLKRTINFCDMFCDPKHVAGEVARVLTMMWRMAQRRADTAVYDDPNMANYLVVPK
jgi:hypothetical protein